MAGPVRLAYRSREAGEGGIDVCARVRPPSPRGRWVRCIRSLVIARPVPPPTPRRAPSSIPGSATSVRRCWRWRTARSSRASRSGRRSAAGGDLVVNTSQTGYQEVCTDPSYAGQVVVMTYPLIGNYGRLADDDQSIRPWLRALVVANATAAVLDDARQLAALLRDDGDPGHRRAWTRGRWPATCATNGCLRGHRHRARRDRSRTRPSRPRGRRRAGRTRTSSARSRRRPITRRRASRRTAAR